LGEKDRNAVFWKKISKLDLVVEEQLDGIVRMFREREALCNLKALSLEKTYKSAQKEISEKV